MYDIRIWKNYWIGAKAHWQGLNLKSNIGYTQMNWKLNGMQYGLSMKYEF
jgi:hypothetical protein